MIEKGAEKMNDDDIIRKAELQKVKNPVSYFTIAKCIEKYRNNEQNTRIYYLLAENYKREKNITIDNVLSKISPISENATIKEMYESEQENEISYYVVYFSENNEYAGGLIVVQDEENEVFAVYPNEFVEESNFQTIENINNLENQIQKIQKNAYNTYNYLYLSNEEIVQRYIENFHEKLITNIEDAYSLLDERCKQDKFETLDKFKKYADENETYWNNMEIKNVEVEPNEEFVEYTFQDNRNNEYYIKETYVMEYTINF